MNIPQELEWVIYGDSAFQMFNWLTPYIEEAGYTWKVEQEMNSHGKITFRAWRIKVQKND